MKKQHVQLTPADRETLETLIRQGEQTAKLYRRALALLELDRSKTYTEVSNTLQVTIPTLSGWAAKYRENGLDALYDQPRSGRPIEIDGAQRSEPRLRPWLVVRRQKAMPSGVCGCWPIKPWNWATASTFPTPKWESC